MSAGGVLAVIFILVIGAAIVFMAWKKKMWCWKEQADASTQLETPMVQAKNNNEKVAAPEAPRQKPEDGKICSDCLPSQRADAMLQVTPANNGETPLYTAARLNHRTCAATALASGADANAPLPGGTTTSAGGRTITAGASPLHTAALYKSKDVVGVLLEAGADPNHQCPRSGVTPLHHVVELNKHWRADTSHGNVQEWGHEDSRKAAKEVLEQLIGAGADKELKDKEGKRPWVKSLEQETLRNAHGNKVLVSGRPNDLQIKRWGSSPTFQCEWEFDIETIDRALAAGISIDRRDDWGRTMMHKAVLHGRTWELKRLIALGADPRIEDKDKLTASQQAAELYLEKVQHETKKAELATMKQLLHDWEQVVKKEGLQRTAPYPKAEAKKALEWKTVSPEERARRNEVREVEVRSGKVGAIRAKRDAKRSERKAALAKATAPPSSSDSGSGAEDDSDNSI